MKITILTHYPSPYQAQLFDAVARRGTCDVFVAYLVAADSSRQWDRTKLGHAHCFLSDAGAVRTAVRSIEAADLAIFNWYKDQTICRLMEARDEGRRPWVFWGERPGFHYHASLGAYYRRWVLRTLHRSHAPIWGIGNWAVGAYRQEFGSHRAYFNVPYASALDAFLAAEDPSSSHMQCRFLHSGSLVRRKGVDVLLKAFMRLLKDRPGAELHFVGDGPLRESLEVGARHRSGNIRFYGFRQMHELPDIYRTADVICVPSRYDGWALTVIEGMAAGMPVIATDRVGAALDAVDEQVGWIARAGDEDDLYYALSKAAALLPEQRVQMGVRARQRARAFDVDRGAARFMEAVHASVESWSLGLRAA